MNNHDDPLFYYEQACVRTDMMAIMPGSPQNVLEVGCGVGKTGEVLKDRYACKVTGIDISPLAIDAARRKSCYSNLLVCDLDQTPIPPEIQSERFDCIFYPDVLEHLKDPWSIIRLHKNLLTPGGCMIASIPNIRHFSIIKDLLVQGKWTYQEFGILDKTHLRFFTKNGMIRLFEQAGFEVVDIRPTSTSGPKYLKWFNQIYQNRLEEFLTIQYLLRASKH